MAIAENNNKKYAVLIPWVKTAEGDALLLEVRSEHVPQPGEVCFPGGQMEPGETAAETAVRETCEELGICPSSVEVLSELGMDTMGNGRKIFPVTARIDPESLDSLTISDCEVADVFLLPAEWLEKNPPAYYDFANMADEELPAKLLFYLSRYADYRYRGDTDYYEYEGHAIWGLTARLIKQAAALRPQL